MLRKLYRIIILYKYSTWDVIFKYNKEDNLRDLLYSKGMVVGSLLTNPKEYEVYRIKSEEAAREIMMLEELKKWILIVNSVVKLLRLHI